VLHEALLLVLTLCSQPVAAFRKGPFRPPVRASRQALPARALACTKDQPLYKW